MKIAAGLAALVIVLALTYGAWHISRAVNYKLSYKSMVEATVCDMVKPDHLNKPCQ